MVFAGVAVLAVAMLADTGACRQAPAVTILDVSILAVPTLVAAVTHGCNRRPFLPFRRDGDGDVDCSITKDRCGLAAARNCRL